MAANIDREFETRRYNALHELYDMDGDRSRKGSVDAPIQALVDVINAHPHMFTTSSCSGRISCFAEPTAETRAAGLKGGEWVYASHDTAEVEDVLAKVAAAATRGGCLVFRMEPFVMHVECRGIEWSALLLGWARQAGFRESGMVPSLKGRCMVGIRCNLRLEVPIADDGSLLVTEDYIRYLVKMANAKFVTNAARHTRFLEILEGMPHRLEDSAAATGPKKQRGKQQPSSEATPSVLGRKSGRGRGRGKGRRKGGNNVAAVALSTSSAALGKVASLGSREGELAARQLTLLERLSAMEERAARLQLRPILDDSSALLLRSLELRCPFGKASDETGVSRGRRPQRQQQTKKKKIGGGVEGAGLSMLDLGRWGLSATHLPGLPGKVVVFGGFGGTSAHRRHGDVLVLDLVAGTLSRPPVAAGLRSPLARCYHSAVPVGKHRLLIIGGRVGPTAPLGDAWLLDTRAWSWATLQSSALPPRFRHSAAVLPVCKGHPSEQVFVFGGCSGDGELLGDAWVLDTGTWQWSKAVVEGAPPCPRHSHASAAAADGRIFIYGGLGSRAPQGLADLHCLTRQQSGAWLSTRVSLPQDAPLNALWPPPTFSATLTAVPAPNGKLASALVLLGGCSTLNHRHAFALDTSSLTWSKHPLAIHSPRTYAAIRHATCFVPNVPGMGAPDTGVLCVVGGGAVCFAFGTIQGGVHCLDVTPFLGRHNASGGSTNHAGGGKRTKQQGRASIKPAKEDTPATVADWVMVLPKRYAKQMKDAVKRAGWLDQSRKGGELSAGNVGLPLLRAGAEALSGAVSDQDSVLAALVRRLVAETGSEVQQMALSNAKRVQSPAKRLREAVSSLLREYGSSLSASEHTALLEQLPLKWERLGELVLLPIGTCAGPEWEVVPQAELWRAIAEALQTSKLARQAPVASTGTRDSQAELLLGGDGWAAHKEHGVLFTLDATKCMFSSGNVTERGRMGRLSAAGETVVDLFAGIGYYTLPILVKAGAAKVIACEWNPHAIEALRANLDANGVSSRCEVRQGDCREAAPKGVADRVLLGLLPSSTCGWATAVAALKSRGGWLHVHENVKDSEEANWIESTVEKFAELAADAGRQWKVSKAHLERVKWYAPHVRHVVLDLHCQEVAEPMEGAVSPPTKPQLA